MSIIWNIIENQKNNHKIINGDYTYCDIYKRICKLCKFINKLGEINVNDNICIISPLSLEYVEVNFVCIGIACTLVHFNIGLDIKKLLFVLNQNKIKLLFIDHKYVNHIKAIEKKIQSLKYIIWINSNGNKIKNSFSNYLYEDILKNNSKIYCCKKTLDNNSIQILYDDTQGTMERILIKPEMILNQIENSIKMLKLKLGDKIIYMTDKCIPNNIWIYFTSMYLGNSLHFSKDIDNLLEIYIKQEGINIIGCEHQFFINKFNNLEKTNIDKVLYYKDTKNQKDIKSKEKILILNIIAIPEVYGNYLIDDKSIRGLAEKKIKKNAKLNNSIGYIEQVLLFSRYIKKFYIYEVNYLLNNKIYVISYKSVKSKNVEENCFKLIDQYINFKKNDRLYFRKQTDFKKKICKKTKYLIKKTDYYKCLAELLIALNEYRIEEIIIENYINSVICKINNIHIVNNDLSILKYQNIIDFINKDLSIELSYSTTINKLSNCIYKCLVQSNPLPLNIKYTFKNKFYYDKNFNYIVGVWIKGDYTFEMLNYSYKNINDKFSLNQKLYSNNCMLYIEDYNNCTIHGIINKYSKLSNLLSIVYLTKGEKIIIFFIVKEIISDEVKNILEIFFYDYCRKCILKKNFKANYVDVNDEINKNKDSGVLTYPLTDNPFLKLNISVLIDFVICFFFIIIKISKFIFNGGKNICNQRIYHTKFDNRIVSKLYKKCGEKEIKISTFFYSAIMLGVSRIYPFSILKIKSTNESLCIPNIYHDSKKNFWELCIKMDDYLNELTKKDYFVSYMIEKYNNKLDKKSLSNLIIEINFLENLNFLCDTKDFKIDNVILLNSNTSFTYNCVFNIYFFDNKLNITFNANNKLNKLDTVFKYINHIVHTMLDT